MGRRTLFVMSLLLLAFPASEAEEPPATVVSVQLKSGKVLQGTIVGTETVGDERRLVIQSDFGRISVPASAVAKKPKEEPPPKGVFLATRILVTRIDGHVERLRPGEAGWVRIRLVDDYGRVDGSTLLKPGDSVRTGPHGLVEMLLHRDVWVRLAADGELVIAAGKEAPATVEVKSGNVQQRVEGKPLGQPYAVKTPTVVCGVKGTRFSTKVKGAVERVAVAEGVVDLGAGRGEVGAGQAGQWTGDGPIVREALSMEDKEDLAREILVPPPLDMVLVPGGRFRGGGNKALGPFTFELSDYMIDRREATNRDYFVFSKATGAEVPSYFVGGKPPPGRADEPISGLHWAEARDFARWCGKDLPTEAQWEAAARGPKGDSYPWGNHPAPADWKLPTVERPAPVGAPTKDIAWCGCEAMGSGVPEWCRDWYVFDPEPPKAPDPQGPERSSTRVFRGFEEDVRERKGGDPKLRESNAGVRGVMELKE